MHDGGHDNDNSMHDGGSMHDGCHENDNSMHDSCHDDDNRMHDVCHDDDNTMQDGSHDDDNRMHDGGHDDDSIVYNDAMIKSVFKNIKLMTYVAFTVLQIFFFYLDRDSIKTMPGFASSEEFIFYFFVNVK